MLLGGKALSRPEALLFREKIEPCRQEEAGGQTELCPKTGGRALSHRLAGARGKRTERRASPWEGSSQERGQECDWDQLLGSLYQEFLEIVRQKLDHRRK